MASSSSSAAAAAAAPPPPPGSGPPGPQASNLPITGRSTSGCHTCRLRKKKCDERHPICANCTSRAIPCYGYGAKPAWMKGDGVEAELVGRIKRAAERNYRARRRGWRPEMGDIGEDGQLVSGSGGFGGAGAGSAGAEMQGVVGGKLGVMLWEEPGSGTRGDGRLPERLPGFGVSRQGEDDEPGGSGSRLSLRQKRSENEQDQDMADETIPPSHPHHPCSTSSSTTYSSTSLAPYSTTPQTFSTFSTTAPPTLAPSPTRASSLWYHSNFAATYSVKSNTELHLLLHYLDNVFPLQFGFSCMKRGRSTTTTSSSSSSSTSFLQSPDHRGRDWYLATLLLCKPLYFATLSISAHHLHLMKEEGNILEAWGIAEIESYDGDVNVGEWRDAGDPAAGGGKVMVAGNNRRGRWNWDAESSFMMALKGLQGVIDDLQSRGQKGMDLLRLRWQVLATMCQVLSLEVFRNLGGNWPIHIQASRTFLSMIGSSTFSTDFVPPTPYYPSDTQQQQQEPQPASLDILEQLLRDDSQKILSSNETAALKHFITSFIWVDIISRASGIPPPTSLCAQVRPFPYLPLLEDSTLDLSLVMGCENWVFITLAQILMLESAMCAERAERTVHLPLSNAIIRDGESDCVSESGSGSGSGSASASASASGSGSGSAGGSASISGRASGTDSGMSSDPFSLDLRSRATILETQLQRGLRILLDMRAIARSNTSGTNSTIDPIKDVHHQSSLVTELFALAAQIYLHVIVHGAWPWLASVRESVNRSLVVLEALPPEVLIRVSWPVVITGCMVLEEGRGRVRGLVARARAKGVNVGTVLKSMVVVEECWRLRYSGGEEEVNAASMGGIGIGIEARWVEAMESLGEKILLV